MGMGVKCGDTVTVTVEEAGTGIPQHRHWKLSSKAFVIESFCLRHLPQQTLPGAGAGSRICFLLHLVV